MRSYLIATDWSPVTVPLVHLLWLALTLLAGILGRAVLAHTKNAREREILRRVGDFMWTEVEAAETAEEPTLEHIAGTAKLTPADAKALRDSVLSRVKENLGPDGLKALNAATGNRSIDDYLLSVLEARVGSLTTVEPPPAPAATSASPVPVTPPALPKGAPGFARFGVLGFVVAMVVAPVLIAAALHGCSAGAVQVQSEGLEVVNLAGNRIEPLWIAEYRREGRAALAAACPVANGTTPSAACGATRLAAERAVTAKWAHVRDAWEALHAVDDAYATQLDACRAVDAGVCTISIPAAFPAAVTVYRCAIRAAGHPEADLVPGPAPECPDPIMTSYDDGGVQ